MDNAHPLVVGVSGVDTSQRELSPYEKSLIDQLTTGFYHSRSRTSIDLDVQSKLSALLQLDPLTLKHMSKTILANFIVQPIKRVITFSKLTYSRTAQIA